MSLKRLLKQKLGLLPTKLPVGVTEFNAWSKSISETYDLPTKDETSTRFTLASIIMHLGPQAAYRSKYYFYLTMVAAASKQVAGAVFYEIKESQKKAAEAALLETQNGLEKQ